MRNKRLYSLFEMQNGKMVRITNLALTKERAIRFWQSALLDNLLAGGPVRELKSVKESLPILGYASE